MPDRFEVIYLTGAPASGKSTVVERLQRSASPLTVFNYGGLLAAHAEWADCNGRVCRDLRMRGK